MATQTYSFSPIYAVESAGSYITSDKIYRYLGSRVSNLRVWIPENTTDHVCVSWTYDKTGFEDLEVVFLVYKNGVFQPPELVDTYATIGGIKLTVFTTIDIYAALSNRSSVFSPNVAYVSAKDHIQVEWLGSPDADVRQYKVKVDGSVQAYIDATTGEIITI